MNPATSPPLLTWQVFSAAPPAALAGTVCIVIDQLRASSSMATALANGAAAVHPCADIDQAIAKASELRALGHQVKLGGERGGLAIEGFDFGNLPREYSHKQVAGVHIVFTTTNGTRAIAHASACGAGAVLIGCLFNRTAVAKRALQLATPEGRNPLAIHLLCAGTRDALTLDDCLAAGAIADSCAALGVDVHGGATLPFGDDTTVLNLELWRLAVQANQVQAILRRSRGGRNLARIGMADEIAALAQLDTLTAVPQLHDGVLRNATGHEVTGHGSAP